MTLRRPRSDALVLFGVTGDLAYKKIFPALYAMERSGTLTVPVVGVASSSWTQAQLHARVAASLGEAGATLDRRALAHLLSRLTYVSADYNDPGAFAAIKKALGRARRPAYYLAIPPGI